MRLPEFSLKKDYEHQESPGLDPISFPSGTLVQPFSDYHLPDYILEELEKQIAPKGSKYVMCLIGRYWVPVLEEDIRRT